MGILDIFKPKTVDKSSNTLFGQTQLGNQIVRTNQNGQQGSAFQLLYVTTSSVTNAGRIVDMSVLSRNSTIMSCVGVKARALAQCGISVMYKCDDGTFVDAIKSDLPGARQGQGQASLGINSRPQQFSKRIRILVSVVDVARLGWRVLYFAFEKR